MTRRGIIKLASVTVLVGVLAFMVVKIVSTASARETAYQSVQHLSDLKTGLIQIDPLNDDPRTTVLVYFNSECEHCIWELKTIAGSISAFDNVNLVLASFQPLEEIDHFLDELNLSGNKNIFRARIEPENVSKVLGSSMLPQLFVYKDDRLQKHFRGEVKLEKILEQL